MLGEILRKLTKEAEPARVRKTCMLSALRHKRGSGDEESYRKFYLETDVTRGQACNVVFRYSHCGVHF